MKLKLTKRAQRRVKLVGAWRRANRTEAPTRFADELEWAKRETGFAILDHQRVFWEDAIESRAFGRAVKSSRRRAAEKELLALRILGPRDTVEADAIMRAIAAHEPFDTQDARIDATEGYLSQMVIQTDKTRRRVETQLWEARSR